MKANHQKNKISKSWGSLALAAVLAAVMMSSCQAAATPPPATTIPRSPSLTAQPTAALEAGETPLSTVPAPTETAEATVVHVPAFPDPGNYRWALVVNGLIRPVDLVTAGDGSGRFFLLEQAGRILIFQDGFLLPDPFLDIRDRVGSTGNEQGLLGLAFSPGYRSDGVFYINYTDWNGNTVIARYRVSADANKADLTSEEALLHISQPYANHNGGDLVFGPDGYLYIGLGDGGSGGDPLGNGQSLHTLLGKLLRIDVNQPTGYRIPSDNPFVNGGGNPEIWAYGLRNPWRFSFDRLTGDLYIADVGQNRWEEIDFLAAGSPGGANFGWNYREAAHPFEGEPPPGLSLQDPIFEYDHNQGCSVTGGAVYRGHMLPEWQGIYLFGDYCRGTIWGLFRDGQGIWQVKSLFETGVYISSFGQDDDGEIYLLDHGNGQVLRLERR